MQRWGLYRGRVRDNARQLEIGSDARHRLLRWIMIILCVCG